MLLYFRNLIYLTLVCQISVVFAHDHLLEGIYCGKENCYEVLHVTREATKNEIAKSYRQLAKKFHPDLHRGEKEKKEAEEKFKEIATAYEILRDDEARSTTTTCWIIPKNTMPIITDITGVGWLLR